MKPGPRSGGPGVCVFPARYRPRMQGEERRLTPERDRTVRALHESSGAASAATQIQNAPSVLKRELAGCGTGPAGAEKGVRTMRLLLILCAAVILAAVPAAAQTWTEAGDAGDLPATAQIPVGAGTLSQIDGTLLTGGDADMYCVHIPNPGVFVATTCGGTTVDTQLWLFDPTGLGVTHDDDDPGGCGLQSSVTGAFVPGPGNYLLAVSQYNWDPLDAAGALIWANSPFNVERAPDGPGAPGPVTGWGTSGFASGPYSIIITGALFCPGSPVRDATWGAIKGLYR